MKHSHTFRKAGFTLLEMMLVVAIIAMLAGLAIWATGGRLEDAKIAKAKADINGITTSLMLYEASNGFAPTTEQGLKALINKPESEPRPRTWRQYMTSMPIDPWGKEYHYKNPGSHKPDGYDLFSAGKDRLPDTADDVGNWDQ
jgi:general secretion pathway protein G